MCNVGLIKIPLEFTTRYLRTNNNITLNPKKEYSGKEWLAAIKNI